MSFPSKRGPVPTTRSDSTSSRSNWEVFTLLGTTEGPVSESRDHDDWEVNDVTSECFPTIHPRLLMSPPRRP